MFLHHEGSVIKEVVSFHVLKAYFSMYCAWKFGWSFFKKNIIFLKYKLIL
jgi:hypothetical protein